ncbi:hypothetical protein BGW38_003353 [Lunasporangiospora selenospora]|uniref:Uncharacterized protein n=1 Tax=Lunasporangiospora selenospora TaxID=979761 RepID=A0A9P6FRA3_9FUNG|nr:hypothetical protein BGW38_003353 [Lunasporangiospora selenospora]
MPRQLWTVSFSLLLVTTASLLAIGIHPTDAFPTLSPSLATAPLAVNEGIGQVTSVAPVIALSPSSVVPASVHTQRDPSIKVYPGVASDVDSTDQEDEEEVSELVEKRSLSSNGELEETKPESQPSHSTMNVFDEQLTAKASPDAGIPKPPAAHGPLPYAGFPIGSPRIPPTSGSPQQPPFHNFRRTTEAANSNFAATETAASHLWSRPLRPDLSMTPFYRETLTCVYNRPDRGTLRCNDGGLYISAALSSPAPSMARPVQSGFPGPSTSATFDPRLSSSQPQWPQQQTSSIKTKRSGFIIPRPSQPHPSTPLPPLPPRIGVPVPMIPMTQQQQQNGQVQQPQKRSTFDAYASYPIVSPSTDRIAWNEDSLLFSTSSSPDTDFAWSKYGGEWGKGSTGWKGEKGWDKGYAGPGKGSNKKGWRRQLVPSATTSPLSSPASPIITGAEKTVTVPINIGLVWDGSNVIPISLSGSGAVAAGMGPGPVGGKIFPSGNTNVVPVQINVPTLIHPDGTMSILPATTV